MFFLCPGHALFPLRLALPRPRRKRNLTRTWVGGPGGAAGLVLVQRQLHSAGVDLRHVVNQVLVVAADLRGWLAGDLSSDFVPAVGGFLRDDDQSLLEELVLVARPRGGGRRRGRLIDHHHPGIVWKHRQSCCARFSCDRVIVCWSYVGCVFIQYNNNKNFFI